MGQMDGDDIERTLSRESADLTKAYMGRAELTGAVLGRATLTRTTLYKAHANGSITGYLQLRNGSPDGAISAPTAPTSARRSPV